MKLEGCSFYVKWRMNLGLTKNLSKLPIVFSNYFKQTCSRRGSLSEWGFSLKQILEVRCSFFFFFFFLFCFVLFFFLFFKVVVVFFFFFVFFFVNLGHRIETITRSRYMDLKTKLEKCLQE